MGVRLDRDLRTLVDYAEVALVTFEEVPQAAPALDATGDPFAGFVERLTTLARDGRRAADGAGGAKRRTAGEQVEALELAKQAYAWQSSVRGALQVVPADASEEVRDAVGRVRRVLTLKSVRVAGALRLLRVAVPELEGAPCLAPWLGHRVELAGSLLARLEAVTSTVSARRVTRATLTSDARALRHETRRELSRLVRAWAVAQEHDPTLPALPFSDPMRDVT